MSMKTAYSLNPDSKEAAEEIRSALSDCNSDLIIFFASSIYEPSEIAAQMAAAFPLAETFGCSTAGEIVSGKMLKNSVVAMAFDQHSVKSAKVVVMDDLNHDSFEAFSAFQRHFHQLMMDMDPQRYVGLVLIDGLCGKEELIIDRIGDLTNVNFIGGSAGDDLKFTATNVYANGKSYTNAAVLAIIEPANTFTFVKTQSFLPLETKFLVTKANEAKREVLEFNNRPASEVYAEAVGATVADASNHFMRNPLGLVFEGVPFVRSPQQIKGDSMVFYCSMSEGMELNLLESKDIIADTRQALESARKELGSISGIINFNCILRTLELVQKEQCDAYGQLFATEPTVGFSTYGEQYIGHINQTATLLVFK